MSSRVGIGFLGGTVFFQGGFCTPLQTMKAHRNLGKGEGAGGALDCL